MSLKTELSLSLYWNNYAVRTCHSKQKVTALGNANFCQRIKIFFLGHNGYLRNRLSHQIHLKLPRKEFRPAPAGGGWVISIGNAYACRGKSRPSPVLRYLKRQCIIDADLIWTTLFIMRIRQCQRIESMA